MSSPTKVSKQSARFIEAAKAAGCDDDPEAFERVFAKVVPPKTGTPRPERKKPSR